jgi:manganese/zinc/iron transport system permease protein
LCILAVAGPALASDGTWEQRSITDTSVSWPGWQELSRVLSLRDYNTRVVILGTTMLGLAAGIIGSFMLLRKRALMGDALSHATLPGVGLAFVVMVAGGGSGKSLPGLLLGALLAGVAGVSCVLLIRGLTRIKEDAALGIVLSVFFGLGVAILGVAQKMDAGHAAGLESFIYGKTASLLARDAILTGVAAAIVAGACALLFKEFALVCFDAEYAGAQGWPTVWLDVLMMALVVLITVIGLQAVGLILMIALLVIPPAAARFWTQDLLRMVLVSAGIGAASGFFGAGVSALVPRLPAGAIIVVVAGLIFVASMLVGPARGLLVQAVGQGRLRHKVARQHLLRAMFEWWEPLLADSGSGRPQPAHVEPVPFDGLLARRSWSRRQLRKTLAGARRRGFVRSVGPGRYVLTEAGLGEAQSVVRNHRLWELYLITHADVATSQVDRHADRLEHVLSRQIVAELEHLLAEEHPHLAVPPSPHVLDRISNGEQRAAGHNPGPAR